MLKMFLSFMGFLFATSVTSQVIINLQFPAGGVTLKAQLWSLSLVNTSREEPLVQMEVVLSDMATNQPILTGSTREFQLKKGVHLLQQAEISPVVYNVLQGGYNIDANPNGFLPIGNFSVCYRVIKFVSDVTEQISEECETIQVEPLSPPMLRMPFDEEESEVTRPLFTWIPPSPFQLFNNLGYDFVLVEVLALQNGSQAIQQNIPIYRQSNLTDNVHAYPLAMPALDTTRLYAWQVTAKSNFNAVAKSEIWTFRVKNGSSKPSSVAPKAIHYAKLKREKDASYTISKGVLHFEYINETNDKLIECSITDISSPSAEKVTLDSTTYAVSFGQNLMAIDLQQLKKIRDGRIYLLEVIDGKREPWYLKFEYKKPD